MICVENGWHVGQAKVLKRESKTILTFEFSEERRETRHGKFGMGADILSVDQLPLMQPAQIGVLYFRSFLYLVLSLLISFSILYTRRNLSSCNCVLSTSSLSILLPPLPPSHLTSHASSSLINAINLSRDPPRDGCKSQASPPSGVKCVWRV